MKRYIVVAILITVLCVVGCVKPPKIEKNEEIKPNETAFVIPLEGATKSGQGALNSVEFLNEKKVAAKRVIIPLREKKVGRFGHQIEWIPTVRVIRVDRSPVTREWRNEEKGSNKTLADGIDVESKDSISFAVGVTVTAAIEEANTAAFLYNFAGKSLSQIMDENVRGMVLAILSREFGQRDLSACKAEKRAIYTVCRGEVTSHFGGLGLTIRNLGNSGGIVYTDVEIQKAINDAYVAEMDIKQATQEKAAQDERNKLMIAKVKAEREAAEEFQLALEAKTAQTQLQIRLMTAEARLTWAKKWNGVLPASMLPSNSPLLMSLGVAP